MPAAVVVANATIVETPDERGRLFVPLGALMWLDEAGRLVDEEITNV
jgi:hypothetical protein